MVEEQQQLAEGADLEDLASVDLDLVEEQAADSAAEADLVEAAEPEIGPEDALIVGKRAIDPTNALSQESPVKVDTFAKFNDRHF